MTQKNKNGLSRYIHPDLKRKIRQNAGFGCVICGLAITQYEHVDPEFAEAERHDPQKMTLLCGSCHHKVTTKFWSKDKVKDAMKLPFCKKRGFASEIFDFSNEPPDLILGSTKWVNSSVIFRVLDKDLLKFTPPEEKSGPFRMSGIFYNNLDQEIFRIEDNEWKGSTQNFDIDVVGNTITIKSSPDKIALQLKVMPPKTISITIINLNYSGAKIISNSDGSIVFRPPNGKGVKLISNSSEINAKFFQSCIQIEEERVIIGRDLNG